MIAYIAPLWIFGVGCLVASVVGKAVKLGGVEIPAITTTRAQLVVALVGVAAIVLGTVLFQHEGSSSTAGSSAAVPSGASSASGASAPAPGTHAGPAAHPDHRTLHHDPAALHRTRYAARHRAARLDGSRGRTRALAGDVDAG
ncbi:hypothetical protein C8250_039990 [Streptomyces sp. So13.3]|uniref:hypothetical protein n=1 Tax=Streptomyces sp. So13.3 TaxID=2136173 RepID=UPI00164CF50A|nr:hypothetical protein [Streptomyces sp. So13.3]QNA70565.1 hypothetical protein C8250_039990 [Streptomyces sp. So13.3]